MNEYNPADQKAGIEYAERVASERFALLGERVTPATKMLMGCAFEAGAAHGRGQMPDGWKLVPVEPTPEMIAAMEAYSGDVYAHPLDASHFREDYAAMLAAAPAAPVSQAEVYLTLAEEEYEAPIVLRAFTSRAEAEAFAQTLRDYQQVRPEWPVGDAEPEEVMERDKETRAWMAAHPGGEDAAWRRFFSVIAVPLYAAEQPDTVAVPRELLAEAESIIDSYAEALKASHAPGGDWEGEEAALDDYEREAGVAAKLRRLLAGGAE